MSVMSTPLAPDAPSGPAKSTAAPGSIDQLTRENDYLKQRNAQLQGDVAAISAEAERLRQILERLNGRSAARAPSPLGGGQ